MQIRSYQDLMLWRPQPLTEIISSGVLYEQTKCVIYGGPKLGKSVLAQQLSMCLVLGIPWIGFHTVKCSVLYVQAEISELLFKDRVMSMGAGKTIPPGTLNFSTVTGLHLDKAEPAQRLQTVVKRHKPDVVILDPKYKLVSSNDENSIIRFTDTVDELILLGTSVVVIEHARKPRMANSGQIIDMGGSELRGPIIEQWADSIIRLRGDLTTDERVVEFELRHAVQPVGFKKLQMERKPLWFKEI